MSFEIAWIGAGNVPEMETLKAWVSLRIWGDPDHDFGPCNAMVVVEGETLLATVILHNFDPKAGVIEISAAGDDRRWMSRKVLRTLFGRIFGEFGCQTCVARVDADNTVLRSIFERFGFTGHCLPNLRGKGKDEIVFLLTDTAWRQGRYAGDHHG